MVTKEISLKTWENNYITVYANKGEVESRYIKVSFKCQDGTNLSLSGKTVTFYAVKPDSTQIYNSCTLDTSANTATVELTSQALSVSGILDCEFQIFNSDNNLLKVTGLKIAASSTPDFSEAIESTEEFNTLTQALNTAQAFSNDAVRGVKVNGTSLTKDSNNAVNIITSDHSIPTFEQGTWTPSLMSWGGTSPTYTSNYKQGKYLKIGNLVYISFYMHANISSAGNTNAFISGLPFTALADTIEQAIAVTQASGGNLAAQTLLTVVNETSYIKVKKITGGDQVWGTTGTIYIGGSGCYIKA